jgi:long-chain acyl-CoA synthetase
LRELAASEVQDVTDDEALVKSPKVLESVRAEVARLTSHLADYERIKRVALLPREFTVEGGEITPTLKVRRRYVEEKYCDLIDALYPA